MELKKTNESNTVPMNPELAAKNELEQLENDLRGFSNSKKPKKLAKDE